MPALIFLPILIPLITALITTLFPRSQRLQRWLNVAGAAALLGAGAALFAVVDQEGIQSVQVGGWTAPFGISLVADLFSSIMVLMAGLVALATAVYSVATIDRRREAFGYYPLLNVLVMGICGAFLTGDIFNLYVWFEVMLMASFVLLALGGETPQMEAAIKYVTINLISSVIFLSAVGILYGLGGTLNMADLSLKLRDASEPGIVTTVAMLFLIAFGIKAAVFPLFFWLPSSYHTPPAAVSVIFAALLTKVGVYSLIRVFTLIFTEDADYIRTIILVVAGLTMITGVLGALIQVEIRRVMSFQIISQIGYMIMGLALFTPLAIAGAIFYLIHDVIVKANLFMISGLAEKLEGTATLRKMGGLYAGQPLLAGLFLITALSLAGVPPFSGFVGKLTLAQAGLEVEQYFIVGILLATGFLSLVSLGRVWAEAFWKSRPESGSRPLSLIKPGALRLAMAPIVVMTVLTIAAGVGGEAVLDVTSRAADQLIHSSSYIDAVRVAAP